MAIRDIEYKDLWRQGLPWNASEDMEGRPRWIISAQVGMPEGLTPSWTGGYWQGSITLPWPGDLPQLPRAEWVYRDRYVEYRGYLGHVDTVNGAKRRLKNILTDLVRLAQETNREGRGSFLDAVWEMRERTARAGEEMARQRRRAG